MSLALRLSTKMHNRDANKKKLFSFTCQLSTVVFVSVHCCMCTWMFKNLTLCVCMCWNNVCVFFYFFFFFLTELCLLRLDLSLLLFLSPSCLLVLWGPVANMHINSHAQQPRAGNCLTPRLLYNKSLMWHVCVSSATLSVCVGVVRWKGQRWDEEKVLMFDTSFLSCL